MQFLSEVYWDRGAGAVNQDSVSLQQVSIRGEKVMFALICDGIGGLAKGEMASGFVAERMTEWFYMEAVRMLKRKKGRKKLVRAGLRALYGCNEDMNIYGKRQGMKFGTTVTMLIMQEKQYVLWHSGDTRMYRIAAGIRGNVKIKQLTADHTADNRTLIRCVGSFSWKEPDIQWGKMKKKDILLLCSDGFRNRMPEEKIGETLHPLFIVSQEQMGMRLKEIAGYAKRHGERDNISAIAVKGF